MSVIAKFKVTSVVPAPGNSGYTITLFPVTSGSKENEEFYKYTPGGQILLSTINEEAVKQFTQDGEYFVEFTKVG